VTIVTVGPSGGIDLPEAVLQDSRVQPGSQLVVLAREGRIILLDAERFRERVEKPAEELLAQFRAALAEDPQAPFFDGLSYAEFAGLSEEAERELWDRLAAEADRQVKGGQDSDQDEHRSDGGRSADERTHCL
jgi:antitoxin component of MazEF toxin-antitoxin module